MTQVLEAAQSDRDLERKHRESAGKPGAQALDTPATAFDGLLSSFGTGGSDTASSPHAAAPLLRQSAGSEVRVLAMRRAQQNLGNQKTQHLVTQFSRRSTPVIQRECACGGTCSSCQAKEVVEEDEPTIAQRQPATFSSSGGDSDGEAPPSDSPGQPLDKATRDFMEPRFGHDFSDVRVHTDSRAADSAQALQANAYTTGRDIYFASGMYAPASQEGQHLLAHELTHTVQQENGEKPMAASPAGGVLVGDAADPLETQAEQVASAVVSDRSAHAEVIPAPCPVVQRDVRSGASAVWDATGGRVVRGVEGLVGDSLESVKGWLESRAPNLMSFLRSDPIEVLKLKISGELEGAFGGIFSRIQREGLFGALVTLASEGQEVVSSVVHSVTADPCGALRTLVKGVIDFQKWMASTSWGLIQRGASAVSGFFSSLWSDLLSPAWDAIKKFAGSVWGWIEARAVEFWEWIKPLRTGIAAVWNKVKQLVGAAWDKGSDVFEWLKGKATAAWERVKAAIQPFLGPLKVIGTALLLLSPLGPILAIGGAAYGLYQAAHWLYNNWNQLDIVVKARALLHQQIIPWIHSAIGTVTSALHSAGKWLHEKAQALREAVAQLAEAIGVNALLRGLHTAVAFIRAKFNQLSDWVAGGFRELTEKVAPTLTRLNNFFQPVAVVLGKLLIAVSNPLLLPIYLDAVAWMILPDCVKPPIIDYILDLMVAGLRAIPNWGFFGEQWPEIKERIAKGLEDKRKAPVEEKIRFTNKVANMIAGPDLTGFSNLFAAARKTPDYFMGQVEEELVGMDLTEPLPLEQRPMSGEGAFAQQSAAGIDSGALSPENAALLQKTTFNEGDVLADRVPQVEMPPEFFDSLQLDSSGSASFAENPNPTITNESLRAELAGLASPQPAGGPGTGAGEADMERPPANLPAEEQIKWFVSHQPAVGCQQTPESAPKGRSQPSSPAMQIFPPLTQSQRALFVWEQMKRGLSQWYQCHKTAVIASLIGALVLFVVLAVLTDGVILELLPGIMEAVGAVFIGVSVLRMSIFIADYIAKATAGDVAGAAKSLARGLAIGAIELLMYLLTAGSGKGAAKAGEKAVEEGVETAAQAGKRAKRPFLEVAADASRRFATNIKNPIGAFMRNGKAFIKGIEAAVVKGASSIKDLGERLLRSLGFKGFNIEIKGGWLLVYGYFNTTIILLEIPFLLQELRGDITEVVLGGKVELRTAKGAGTYAKIITLAKDDLDAISQLLRENKDLIEAAKRAQTRGMKISVLDDFLFWTEGHHTLPMWMGGPAIPYRSPGLLGLSRLLHNFDPAGVHSAINALWRDSLIFGKVAVNDGEEVRKMFRNALPGQRAIMMAELRRIMEQAYRQTFRGGPALEHALEALEDGLKNFRY